jgi:hypothetical protein
MGKIPVADWKQWAVSNATWLRKEIKAAVEWFMEQK